MSNPNQTTNQIQQLVDSSGNKFHSKVVEFLRANSWTVLVSPYYNDNLTDKPREIDIVAEKQFDVRGFNRGWLGTVNVKLFIECKYIQQETVFWFDEKDKERAIQRVMTDTGLGHPLENADINNHHYLQNSLVAKLFTSKIDKHQENELIYKALNQSLNAMVYYKNSESIIPERISIERKILKTLNYPLIICNSFDKFYRVKIGGNDKPKELKDKFQLEVNYAYLDQDKKHQSDYFLIDVIEFNHLEDFLPEVKKTDVDTVVQNILWKIRARKRQS